MSTLHLIPVLKFDSLPVIGEDYWTIQLQTVPDATQQWREEHPVRFYELHNRLYQLDVEGNQLWYAMADTCYKFRTIACRAARVALVGMWTKKVNVLVTYRHNGVQVMWGAFIIRKDGEEWISDAERYQEV